MVGGTIFHREMIQREISRALVLNLSGKASGAPTLHRRSLPLTEPSLLSRAPARGRITEVTPCVPAPAQLRCKIAAGSSVRRRYDKTNCCFHAADRLECCMVNTGSSSTHQCRRKCTPVPVGQDAAKNVKEGRQETAESNEEIREGATEGGQEGAKSR